MTNSGAAIQSSPTSHSRSDRASSTSPGWTFTLPGHLQAKLWGHLFPGDDDEHGAVILAGVAKTDDGLRLLAREVVLARDGVEYVPGKRGYRMLTAEFVTRQITRARDQGLIYLAAHNHGGCNEVAFSAPDLESQARGYPALLDINRGRPVGALVIATNAVAGRLWVSKDEQLTLNSARILAPRITDLYPQLLPAPRGRPAAYDRQARIFGDRGQDILSKLTVGVIGAGGVGSLVVEYLARLGVGGFVIVDPERLDLTNVPRVTGSTRWDAMALLTSPGRPWWLQRLGHRLAKPKVKIMERLIRRANPKARVEALRADFVDDSVARRFLKCDYLFLAADSMQARLVFNAIVHAYLIPGVQIGAKVPVDHTTGLVGEVFTVSRPVSPGLGCLLCNSLISSKGLQQEAETAAERRLQRYVDEEGVTAPSVITLNATAVGHAVNDFLFAITGLAQDDARLDYLRILPRRRRIVFETPTRDPACPQCGVEPGIGALGLGDAASLFTRER